MHNADVVADTKPPKRFGARLALTLFVAVPAAVLAGLLAVAVESAWDPFRELDQHTASYLHDRATGHPLVIKTLLRVSDVGGPAPARILIGVVAAVLWWRGARRLALWAVSTMAAGAVLDTGLKTLVDRTRPHLPHPFAHAPGGSFPSGHAMTSALACGILVLILLPLVRGAAKAAVWTVAALVVFAVGYSRVALGVHWVTDVVGAWLLAVALLAASVSAFQTWRVEHGLRPARLVTEGVEPEEPHEPAEPAEPSEPSEPSEPTEPSEPPEPEAVRPTGHDHQSGGRA